MMMIDDDAGLSEFHVTIVDSSSLRRRLPPVASSEAVATTVS